jgi:hypothetical protein
MSVVIVEPYVNGIASTLFGHIGKPAFHIG